MISNRTHIDRRDLVAFLLVGFFVLMVLIPVSPVVMPVAGRDSGVFLYTGWRMLNGDIPYKDIWDHKPPIIFFLNALGLLVSDNSRWGVWLIEVVALFGAALISLKLFQKAFDHLTAVIGTCLWLFTLTFMLDGGNYTTEYALSLQFACIWLAWDSEVKASYKRRGLLIGILSGILFFTKQNLIGIFIAILAYILISRSLSRKWCEMLQISALLLGGFLLVIALITLLFIVWGALPDFWNAAFIYNVAYSAIPRLSDHLQAIYRGWLLLLRTNLAWFGFLGWSIALLTITIIRSKIKLALLPLLAIGIIDLPIELALAALGGRLINHHFIVLLPIFALFTAFFFNLFFKGVLSWMGDVQQRKANLVLLLAVALTFPVVSAKQIKDYIDTAIAYRSDAYQTAQVVEYIVQNTGPADTVLVLDAEAYVNFASRRLSPTRYVYQYPLQMQGYATEVMVEGFLNGVIERPPALIVDKVGNWIRPENFPVRSAEIDRLIAVIQKGYSLVDQIDPWSIYRYSGK